MASGHAEGFLLASPATVPHDHHGQVPRRLASWLPHMTLLHAPCCGEVTLHFSVTAAMNSQRHWVT